MSLSPAISSLSPDVKQFLDEHIRNVEDLEVLLLLRSDGKKDWDALDVSKHIGMEPISASNLLMRLHLQGLLGHQKSAGKLFQYRYSPAPAKQDRHLEEIQAVFSKSRMEIVNYIVTRQRRQLEAFADAFQVKKDRMDG